MFLTIRYCMSLKLEEQEMYMRLTQREKEMADMFEHIETEEQKQQRKEKSRYEQRW